MPPELEHHRFFSRLLVVRAVFGLLALYISLTEPFDRMLVGCLSVLALTLLCESAYKILVHYDEAQQRYAAAQAHRLAQAQAAARAREALVAAQREATAQYLDVDAFRRRSTDSTG